MKIMSPGQLSRIVYFSMEIGLESNLPTYSGGLGVLAGDTLRSAADLGLHMVGMSLVYRQGYFRQHLDAQGNQTESPASWTPEKILEPMEPEVTVTIEGRQVKVRAWRYEIQGLSGHKVPVYFQTRRCRKTPHGTRHSPTTSMAATPITACVRRWSWEWVE